MGYNPNIHYRKSIRLKGYDYSQAGLYFITICVQDRKCLFGKIIDDEMILNDAGKIADECWLEIPNHFPNAVLHEHVVMPNHVHGIVELVNAVGAENFLPVQNFQPLPDDTKPNIDAQNFQHLPPQSQPPQTDSSIGAEDFLPLRPANEPSRNEFQKMIPRSIGSIVKGFKIGVTKWFRNNSARVENAGVENFQPLRSLPVKNFQPLKIWQRNYHEHIIRDEQSYRRISEYIINNPKNWKEDTFYQE